MKAKLYWQQTQEERYDSPQTSLAEETASKWVTVLWSEGGASFGEGFVAEEEMQVQGSLRNIKTVHGILENWLDRDVKLTWVWPWSSLIAEARWWYYRTFKSKDNSEATDNVTWLPTDDEKENDG